jgi:lysyl-tRNA synthetase class 1
MAGKDLIESVTLSSKICKALGGTPPEGFNYELFLDEHGEKISKSRGNGLTIENWLTYATPESLSLFMFQKPKSAKKLYFDVIPRAVDEYLHFLSSYPNQDAKQQLDNPIWHIHAGTPPKPELPITFGLLLNLASVSNAENKDVMWGFLRRYAQGATPENNPILDRLSEYAIRYFDDFVRPTKKFRSPDAVEAEALAKVDAALAALPEDAGADQIQNALLDVGRAIPRYQDATKVSPSGGPGVKLDWFQAIYETLLGQQRGPRLGTFIALYGIPEMRALIAKALSGALANA